MEENSRLKKDNEQKESEIKELNSEILNMSKSFNEQEELFDSQNKELRDLKGK